MSDDSTMELGFVDKAGEKVSFNQIAKSLPKEYPSIGEHDLPTNTERATIEGVDRFYDFFQVIYVDERRTASKYFPNKIGWYYRDHSSAFLIT